MPVVTRSQSKKMQLKELQDVVSDTLDTIINSIDNIQDRLTTDTSLIYELYEIDTDPKNYKKIYVKKEQNCSFDKLIKDMILFLICICLYLTANLLFYGAKKN